MLMDCKRGIQQQEMQSQTKAEAYSTVDQNPQRRSANYKPNIWKYEILQSLASEYNEERYKILAEELKDEVKCFFADAEGTLAKLELVDKVGKLGLANFFDGEIKEVLDNIASTKSKRADRKEDLYATALCFRLLRQYGNRGSEEGIVFMELRDDISRLMKNADSDVKRMLELFESSNLALEADEILDDAKRISTEYIEGLLSNVPEALATELACSLALPLQRRVEWYDVKRHIQRYEKEDNTNSVMLKLAKLHFNMVQAIHQQELREVSRWWKNLEVANNLNFTRDRMVESYLWVVGVACEPKYGNLRKWLTKVVKLVLIVDDIYDLYGTLEELQQFTNAVNRWNPMDVHGLPGCMQICFYALYETTNEMASEIEEKGWTLVLPHLQKVWADFCNALFAEAKWYHENYYPSFQEYLDNGWVSSCGAVLSLHAFFAVTQETTQEVIDLLESCEELVHCISLIIRLCNDQGTSAAELERGDAPSSILCFMREANASEEMARENIKNLITSTWKKINSQCTNKSPLLQEFIKCTINMARVAQFIYQKGDGFGIQDGETRDHVISLLIKPLPLN